MKHVSRASGSSLSVIGIRTLAQPRVCEYDKRCRCHVVGARRCAVRGQRRGSGLIMTDEIGDLRRSIWSEYQESVGLTADARYYGGARLRPVVPLDTGIGGVFILGAYPSARFETVGSENDVPVGDNLGPFEPERYFDGRRVRTQASADELAEYYLKPLGLDRRTCWITDIVKVFLFKEGHRDKYSRLGAVPPAGYERECFEELADRSLHWLERELRVARPPIMITLGAEIAGLLRNVRGQERRNDLLGKEPTLFTIGETEVMTVHLAHPGIVMRKGDGERNPWPKRHMEAHVPMLQRWLDDPRRTIGCGSAAAEGGKASS